MANIHDIFKEDDTNGIVVGTMYKVGQLYYEDRPQGRQLYATSEAELKDKARRLKQEMLNDCGTVVEYIYPNKQAWILKILD